MRLGIVVEGAAWITASGVGSLTGGCGFSMPAGNLPELRKEWLSARPERWGRLDDYSKAGLIAASLAVEDAGIDTADPSVVTGVVVSTVTGCADIDGAYYQTVLPQRGLLASPNLFAYTLPNCMLGEISIRYAFTGPAVVVSQMTPTMLDGITTGARLLGYGLCERIVAGYCNLGMETEAVKTECRAGAVFLVMQKTEEDAEVTYNSGGLLYKGSEVSDVMDLMDKIQKNL